MEPQTIKERIEGVVTGNRGYETRKWGEDIFEDYRYSNMSEEINARRALLNMDVKDGKFPREKDRSLADKFEARSFIHDCFNSSCLSPANYIEIDLNEPELFDMAYLGGEGHNNEPLFSGEDDPLSGVKKYSSRIEPLEKPLDFLEEKELGSSFFCDENPEKN